MEDLIQSQINAAKGQGTNELIPPAPEFSMNAKFNGVFDQTPAEEPVSAEEVKEVLNQEATEPVAEPAEETVAAPTEKTEEGQQTVLKDFSSLQDIKLSSRFNVGRADKNVLPDTRKKVEHLDIYNWSLRFFLSEYYRSNSINEFIEIQGVNIGKAGDTGIWEEGGSNSDEGMVILATDPDGEKIPPNIVHHTPAINGKHALVQVWVGCYILMGGHRGGKPVLAVYKIEDIKMYESEQGRRFPRYQCQLISVRDSSTWDAPAVQNVNDSSNTHWTSTHPAIVAAKDRIYELNASGPAYVANFKQFFVDRDDYNSVLSDQEFLANRKVYSNLTDAYEEISDLLRKETYAKEDYNKDICPVIYMNQQFVETANGISCVAVFLMGVLYDRTTKSSAGKRLVYGVVLITSESEIDFYYPDKSDYFGIPFDKYSEIVKKKNPMISAFRLMV